MECRDIISIPAILISPAIAVCVKVAQRKMAFGQGKGYNGRDKRDKNLPSEDF